jgi:hypothetical protein
MRNMPRQRASANSRALNLYLRVQFRLVCDSLPFITLSYPFFISFHWASWVSDPYSSFTLPFGALGAMQASRRRHRYISSANDDPPSSIGNCPPNGDRVQRRCASVPVQGRAPACACQEVHRVAVDRSIIVSRQRCVGTRAALKIP